MLRDQLEGGMSLSAFCWKEGCAGVGVLNLGRCVELDLVQEKRKEAAWTNLQYHISLIA